MFYAPYVFSPDFHILFLFAMVGHIKKNFEGRGFRGGSDEKMRRMWLRREIVAFGLPSLDAQGALSKKFLVLVFQD